jgi:hypothetical protein
MLSTTPYRFVCGVEVLFYTAIILMPVKTDSSGHRLKCRFSPRTSPETVRKIKIPGLAVKLTSVFRLSIPNDSSGHWLGRRFSPRTSPETVKKIQILGPAAKLTLVFRVSIPNTRKRHQH